MKGDFTKFRFDPTKRFTRVLKQQGRVDLDSDWNEYNDIRNYFERTTRIDTLGHYGAPVDSADAGFAVGFNGADLTFTAGRLYVEGIVCELFQNTTYLTQPFLPNPPALNPNPGNTDAVYLDVWERHITALEDQSILEVALGGPDTTTRVRTIFQIRVAGNVGGITCNQMPPAPVSGGLMTPSVQPAPPPDDPCQLAPSGGYRGLENRLYRVEIHDPGNLGAATFKWSRDDGSVVFAVTEFPTGEPKKIRVARLGRDQVLALRFNDWVEVLGEESELSGTPGTMAQITNIDPTNLELTLSADVSAHANEHNPKVRRWDQPSAPITVTAGPIPLEDGIQVSFAGANFLSFDYWTFAARTLLPSQLDGQPRAWPPLQPPNAPAGIVHYYVPLALVTWQAGGNPQIHDCRPKRSGGCCCCSVTVGDGTTSQGDFNDIQQAIDSLGTSATPAEVCILNGTFRLQKPVTITRSQLLIRGCGESTIIIGPETSAAFIVSPVSDITFDSLVVRLLGSQAALNSQCDQLSVVNCQFLSEAGPFAILAQGGALRISWNLFRSAGIWILDGSSQVGIRYNEIRGGRGPGIALGALPPNAALSDTASGVVQVEIRENYIASKGNSGITTAFDDQQDDRFGDIEDLVIADNVIENCGLAGPAAPYSQLAVGGIVLQLSDRVRIFGNQLTGNAALQSPCCGIFAQSVTELEISENRVVDYGSGQAPTGPNCLDFTTKPVGTIANPFLDLNTAALFSVQNNAQTANVIATASGPALDCTAGLVVALLNPTPSVDADVTFAAAAGQGGSAVFTALDANQNVVATQAVAAAGGIQHVTLAGAQSISFVSLASGGSSPALLRMCFVQMIPAQQYQGGVILDRISLLEISLTGLPALRIHHNVVSTPAGHALWVSRSRGSMSITDNALTSQGIYLQPGPAFQPVVVFISNLGSPAFLANQAVGLLDLLHARFVPTAPAGISPKLLQDGRVLFRGNQVNFLPVDSVPSFNVLNYIVTLDDMLIESNQFESSGSSVPLADLVSFGYTSRAFGNRIWEFPARALTSYFALGAVLNVSNNQAMNCICGFAPNSIVQNNQVLMDPSNQTCNAAQGTCTFVANILGI